MWPFNRKKDFYENVPTLSMAEIPLTTLVRWYLYDVEMENPNKIADALGLTPVSMEGDEAERNDSKLRVQEVEPFLQFIDVISEINAQAFMAVQLPDFLNAGSIPEEFIEEAKEHLFTLYHQISFAALFAALSSGLYIGILDNPGKEFTESK